MPRYFGPAIDPARGLGFLGESDDGGAFDMGGFDPSSYNYGWEPEAYPGGGSYNPDTAPQWERNATAQVAILNAGAVTDQQAAVIAAQQGADQVTVNGKTIRVETTSTPPNNPDANTWYKIGSMLYRATGQYSANGAPIYTQASYSRPMNWTLIAAIAGLAFALTS